MSRPFRFKQFNIDQNQSPFKVGTDGVLLGAWASKSYNPARILDIGFGTGLIAIMLAQRFLNAEVHAIEIEDTAFEQGQVNMQNCPWNDRIHPHHSSIQEFTSELNFDLIVCNPPFFSNSKTSGMDSSDTARHTIKLTFQELVPSVRSLLHKDGVFSLIIPSMREEEILELASAEGFHLIRRLGVHPTPQSEVKRVLLEFSLNEGTTSHESMVLEYSRHNYSPEYMSLTKDFYLKA